MSAMTESWIQSQREETAAETDHPVLSTAETAECSCPEFCERDHELD